ncbi:hypothetical protein JTE90_009475 [Oedothorax gibbosus]|uniref:Gustatory receptor n=1 Tax=Oedothorax gibbosus TaxID=931172 RepID=A0AAV6VV73_9ARAC|nr:hypothetical protein JTE90_009475 [Oedothorax gibbosus]
MQFPSLITLSICLLVREFKNVLVAYRRQLMCLQLDSGNNLSLLNEYFHILKTLRYLKKVLSLPLLLLTVNAFISLYTALSYFLNNNSGVSTVLESVTNALTWCVVLVLVTLSCSGIPDNLLSIKMSAGNLIQQNKRNISNKEALFLLNRIEKSETVHLTAGGMVDIRKDFLLTAFGALFTYGLLIFNLK